MKRRPDVPETWGCLQLAAASTGSKEPRECHICGASWSYPSEPAGRRRSPSLDLGYPQNPFPSPTKAPVPSWIRLHLAAFACGGSSLKATISSLSESCFPPSRPFEAHWPGSPFPTDPTTSSLPEYRFSGLNRASYVSVLLRTCRLRCPDVSVRAARLPPPLSPTRSRAAGQLRASRLAEQGPAGHPWPSPALHPESDAFGSPSLPNARHALLSVFQKEKNEKQGDEITCPNSPALLPPIRHLPRSSGRMRSALTPASRL